MFALYMLFVPVVSGISSIQPKIYDDDGHLIIESAKDRNISFILPGEGCLVANDTNLMSYLNPWQPPAEVDDFERVGSIADQVNDLKRALTGPNGLFRRVDRLENATRSQDMRPILRLRRRIRLLTARVAYIEAKLKEDNCTGNPCQNGGKCYDLYEDFRCKCPGNWMGKTCNVDVDECYMFLGTDLGCQNKAVCVNTIGSYRCECTQGWKGLHCTKREVDCYTSPRDLCGNGVCVPQSNNLGYSCICNQGWKANNDTPACTEDIDECAELTHRCVSNCINLPGDFMCGPCPAGYTGDGITCTDINECENNNGGCSLAPRVRCINTEGSFRCGNCPMGYSGNGKTCTWDENSCQSYGICYPEATCRYVSNSVICTCPPGMTGNGYGPTGCALIGVEACNPNQCKNGGTCRPHGASYICICPPGFEEAQCEIPNPCKNNPCKNGGTCLRRLNRNYRCMCTSEFQGTNCEDDRVLCGSILQVASGSISYPRSGNYKSNERCAWVIKTNENKILNVTFTKFNLENHPTCLKDFLQIHDGRSAAAHLIGRFCGTNLPKGGNFTSTHSMLYFWFKSDALGQRSGFTLSWNTTEPICGGRIVVTSHGVIHSPGYPAKSPPNRDCVWVLEASPGKVLELVFYEVNLPKVSNCDGDFLEVSDGGVETRLLEKFCNQTTPAPIKSGFNEVVITFHTDSINFDSSFQLHYSPVEGLHFCGGVFTHPEGGFESPKYGTLDGSRMMCNYLIQTSRDTVIQLDFPSLNFGSLLDCATNALIIYDGKTDRDRLIDIWCRSGTPMNYTSTSNAMLVTYMYTSKGRHGFDFQAHYKISCGGIYKELSGSFVSPLSPEEYLPNMHCFYIIEAPQGFVVTLEMEYFEMSHKYYWTPESCNYTDHITIYSPIVNDDSVIGTYCKSIPVMITSKYNRMVVEFFSDDNMQFKGFKALYKAEEVGCGGVLSDVNGTINFLNSKEVNQCEWILNAPENNHIFVNFDKFHILDNTNCEKNFLKAKDLSDNTRDKHMGTFCGSNRPRSGTFATNTLSLLFYAETPSSVDEFSATYQFLDTHSTVCRSNAVEFVAPSGSLYSPGWPGNYFPNLNCSWIIQAPMGQQIVLDVKSFGLETSSSSYDYVEIRDGRYSDSSPTRKFYGTNIPKRIVSFTNSLYIRFVTDDSVQKEGFLFEWQTTTTGCGGTLNSYQGFILPPHYPDLISPGAQCDWRIVVNPGSSIAAVVTSQNFEELGGCETNHIIVFNGDNPSADKIKPNCSGQALRYNSTRNNMLIRYKTDANEESSFLVNYNAQCGGELRDFRGVLESPNFPNLYPDNLDCKWDIISTRGNKIVAALSHLDLEGVDCYYDKLRILDIKHGVQLNEYLLCSDESRNQVITALGDTLRVHFRSDYQGSATGFRLEYELQGCSKHLSSQVVLGRFESPDYPYAVDVHCEWVIEAPYGKLVELRITQILFEGSRDDCSKNGLFVYSDEARNNSLIKICTSHSETVTVTSAGPKMLITFITDNVRTKKCFRASYIMKSGKCGGTYNAPSGSIISPNFPSKYPKGAYCEWLVNSGEHHTVDLSFEQFNIPNITNCEDSFLAVYDGTEKKAEHLVVKHCGTILPLKSVVQSTQQKMLVVFKASNTAEPGLGFKIFYKRNCGRNIIDKSNGFFIKGYNDNNCIWTISSTNSSAHVTLHFAHVECSCGANLPDYCEQNLGVQVYDGYSIEAPRKTSFCTKHPLTIYSNGPALTIRAVSGYFQAYYNLFENACGGKLTSVRGEFATPKYPNSYPPNVECVWEIIAEEGNTIELSFNSFQVHKTSELCNEDYVEIREFGGGGTLLGVFCGNEPPQSIKVYQRAWIKFRSDEEFVGDGFLATWSYAHESEINGTSGTLKSPPIENVNNDPENYKWRIVVPRGNLIELNFHQYVDGLQLFDGFDETALPVAFEYKSTIASSTNIVYITSLNSLLRPFSIRWKAVPKNTTEEVEGSNTCPKKIIVIPINGLVNLTSPGYPGYSNDLDCEWILKTNDSSVHVLLKFYGAELEKNSDCQYDYLQIFSGENLFDWTLEKTYCNQTIRNWPIKIFHGTPYSKLIFRTDSSINGTGFIIKATTFCGGDFTEPQGVIKGTSVSSQFFGPRNCTWTIRATPGRRIKFHFTKLNIPAPTDHRKCDAYISLRDGFDEGAGFLGTGMFCKGSNLTIPETTTNRAFVRAFMSHFQDMDWELQYTTVSDFCGGPVHITRERNSTNITTPNYPDVPSPYSECIWTVLGPPGETLQITFLDTFDLHASWNCAAEYVEVRDGSTNIAKLIKKFCRKQRLISSTGNAFYIKYFTNSSEPRNGFKAHITLGKCGGSFTLQGVQDIMSKNYPSPGGYPSNSVCEYKINVWRLQGINITFNDVHLPVRKNRNESDHLTFYVEDDILNGTMVEVATIYGDNVPPFLEITNNQVLFKFFSYQPNTEYRGYSFTFKRISNQCSRVITAESGQIIVSRRIARQAFTLCSWFITVPRGRRINLVVEEFDGGDGTLSDYIFGFFNDLQKRHKILSTSNIAEIRTVKSTENKMLIRLFKASSRSLYAKLNFTSYELSYCPTDITEDSGTLIAPDVSEKYFCTTEYQTTLAQTIAFKISELVVELVSTTANSSSSTVFNRKPDSLTIKAMRYLVMFETSRNTTDVLVVVAARNGYVQIVQDEARKIKRLVIHYKKHNCGGGYLVDTDTIISKPDLKTHNGTIDCAWSVRLAHQIKFNLNASFSLNPDCEKEYILIYTGNGPSAPQMPKICGNATLSQNVTSNIYVHYHNEATNFASKFEIILTKARSCGGTIYHHYGYPSDVIIAKNDYLNNIECVWNLEYKPGFTSEVSFTGRFFIEDSVNCTKDYVQIRGLQNNEWKTSPRFCGRHVPEKFNMTHTTLMVIFRTDNNTVGDGFRISFKMMCGGVYEVTKQPQTLTFDFWDVYSYDLRCNYTLHTYTEDRIQVHFNSMDLGATKWCTDSFVEVYKGNERNAVGKYCSMENLKDIHATSTVMLLFQGQNDLVPNFSFNYQLESCGGVIREEATIQNLPHETSEDSYAENMNCIWNITGPPGTSVFIEFKYFDLYKQHECLYDYVEIFAGHAMSDANRKAHICAEPKQQNLLYKIPENKAIVRAVSDFGLSRGKGFSAEIKFRKKCDENVVLTQQNSTYVFDRFANGYERNLNCFYVFRAPAGNYVKMIFHSFNLTACSHNEVCTCDFLETRDGDESSNSTLDTFCGYNLPPAVISSRNTLFVHFASDDADFGKGFNATVTFMPSPCGPSDIVFNETKTIIIHSPDDNGHYPPNIVCHWTLHYEKPVEFHFEQFDLEEPQDGRCLDFLEISYVPFRFLSESSPQRTRQILCGDLKTYSYYLSRESAELTFRTNSEVQRRGFRAVLRLAYECNTTYTTLSGTIAKKQGDDDCVVYFKVPTTYTMSFVVEHTYFDSNCSRMVQFYDENTNQQVQTTCSSLQTAFVNSNNVKVKFPKDSILPPFALQMTYIATNSGLGCGGDLYGNQGRIPSPLYPKSDGNYSCQWNIRVPQGLLIHLWFIEFDMGSIATCSRNYLQVFKVSNTGEMTEARRFCGDEKPSIYFADSNKLVLVYHKLIDFEGSGWMASYQAYEGSVSKAIQFT